MGEQQQGERVSYRPQLQFSEITINFFFLTGAINKRSLQHVGPESLVCGAEPEQVPFCSGSVAETLKKVVIKSCVMEAKTQASFIILAFVMLKCYHWSSHRLAHLILCGCFHRYVMLKHSQHKLAPLCSPESRLPCR